jgi:hypothetical protein
MPTDKIQIQLSFANEVKKHYGTEIDQIGAENPSTPTQPLDFSFIHSRGIGSSKEAPVNISVRVSVRNGSEQNV